MQTAITILASIVASMATAYMMMHMFINRLEQIDNAYRKKMADMVVDVIERKIKSTQ